MRDLFALLGVIGLDRLAQVIRVRTRLGSSFVIARALRDPGDDERRLRRATTQRIPRQR